MQETVYIQDEFTTIIGKVNTALANAGFFTGVLQGKQVNFMYGPPIEIVTRLQELTEGVQSRNKKYPLVALFTDIKIEKGVQVNLFGKTKLNLIIANITESTYYAEQRYTNNFKPVLYPVYNELLNQTLYHKQFQFKNADEMTHTAIDRLFWGKQGLYGKEGNIFNDFLDCIEIQDLEITIKEKICSPSLK